MKHIPLFTFTFCLHLSLFAAVPLRWTVETSRAQPATFEAYQGETLALEATMQSAGKPLDMSGLAAFYWQTNGMGSAYWEASAAVNSNRLSAVFTPEMDVGAKVYNCFIGVPGTIYHAAFQLRLRPSPGATPNVLPLPVPVIDFAKVRVLNPPWEGGGGGGVDTNAVRDIAREEIAPATNRLNQTLTDSTNRLYKTIIDAKDGAARPLPKYLHLYNADDSYPEAAEEYYRSRGNGKTDGGCSSVRDGGFLYRNFDYPFDDRAEFVVKMSAGKDRFASVGVAQVGTNLTEQIVTSGKWSKWYKALPGATVDGINENGVACNINVVGGDPQTSGWHRTTIPNPIHPLGAIRWILDNSTNAQQAATYIASHIRFPSGWTQNFHYMIADEAATLIVENGTAYQVTNGVPAMTNFRLYGDPKDTTGEGQERYVALTNGANITSQWWTLTYTANGYRASDLPGITVEDLTRLFNYWENNPRESHRGESFGDKVWWQTVHTSIYDITNRVLRVAVQETDDWYTFQVPSAGGVKVETDPTVPAWAKAENPPQGMTDNALVWTNSAVKTKGGAKTIGAADVGALPSVPYINIDTNEYEDPWMNTGFNIGSYSEKMYFGNFHDKCGMIGMEGEGYWDDAYLVLGDFIKTGEYTYDGLNQLVFSPNQRLGGHLNWIVNNGYGNQYLYSYTLPQRSGMFAIDDWSSLRTMLTDANTNPTADCECIKTNMCNLVHDGIVDTVNTTKSRFYDTGLGVEWTLVPNNGEFMFIATTNVNREVIQ